MTDTKTRCVVNEYIEPGLRYTEEVGYTVRSLPKRFCALWLDGVAEPICDLDIVSFQQRFGAVAVAAEGIGGVETALAYRRQGYLRKLMARVLAGMQQRVSVAFVSEAIAKLYEKFGFVSCLSEARIVLRMRNLVALLDGYQKAEDRAQVRPYEPNDLPEMVRLYNTIHGHRPWTQVRQPGWNQLHPHQLWSPGSEAIVVDADDGLAGYAIYRGTIFGRPASSFAVDEFAAQHSAAAQALLAAVAAHCWDLRLSEFTVQEPIDSVVGWQARQLGCDYVQFFPATGEMMGQIFDREKLLQALKPELRRRTADVEWSNAHEAAFAALLQGKLVPDSAALLRLLIGFWSTANAKMAGVTFADDHQQISAHWFPGAGTQLLPTPYAHTLDRY